MPYAKGNEPAEYLRMKRLRLRALRIANRGMRIKLPHEYHQLYVKHKATLLDRNADKITRNRQHAKAQRKALTQLRVRWAGTWEDLYQSAIRKLIEEDWRG